MIFFFGLSAGGVVEDGTSEEAGVTTMTDESSVAALDDGATFLGIRVLDALEEEEESDRLLTILRGAMTTQEGKVKIHDYQIKNVPLNF